MKNSKAPALKATKMKDQCDWNGTYWNKTPQYREEFHLDIRKTNKDVCN